MVKPYIYAVSDRRYYDLYGRAFLSSSKANGHVTRVYTCWRVAETPSDKWSLLVLRYRLLPVLLDRHEAVLMCDVDTIFRQPVEIEDAYDLGLYLREGREEASKKTLCSVLYCTHRARSFAQALADEVSADGLGWGDDQAIAYRLYEEMRDSFHVKRFDTKFLGWSDNHTEAPLLTGKGSRKDEPTFKEALAKWAA